MLVSIGLVGMLLEAAAKHWGVNALEGQAEGSHLFWEDLYEVSKPFVCRHVQALSTDPLILHTSAHAFVGLHALSLCCCASSLLMTSLSLSCTTCMISAIF